MYSCKTRLDTFFPFSCPFLYVIFAWFSAELRAELASQIERERELRDQAEKQLNEEQKIRRKYIQRESIEWQSDFQEY
jgi:hypothetical protein